MQLLFVRWPFVPLARTDWLQIDCFWPTVQPVDGWVDGKRRMARRNNIMLSIPNYNFAIFMERIHDLFTHQTLKLSNYRCHMWNRSTQPRAFLAYSCEILWFFVRLIFVVAFSVSRHLLFPVCRFFFVFISMADVDSVKSRVWVITDIRVAGSNYLLSVCTESSNIISGNSSGPTELKVACLFA